MSARSSFVERVNREFWRRCVRSTDAGDDAGPDSVAAFRVLFALLIVVLWAPYFSWIGALPAALFEPPVLSPMLLLPGFPPRSLLLVLEAVALASLPCIIVGYKTRLFTGAFVVAAGAGYAVHSCLGKIDHDILFYAVIVCLMLARWGARLSCDARAIRQDDASLRFCVQRGRALYGVLVAFGMLTAGVPKLMSWVDFDPTQSGFMAWFYPNFFALGRDRLLAPYATQLPPLAFELGDYAAVALELSGFVALLVGRRAWLAWLFIASSFHLMNTLVLNIPFGAQCMSYLAFANLARFPTVARPLRSARVRLALGVVGALAALAQIAGRVAGHASSLVGVSDAELHNAAMSDVTIVICLLAMLTLAREVRAAKP